MRTQAQPKARQPQAASEAPETAAPSAASAIEGGAPEFAARLVPLDPGFYAFSLAAGSGWRDPVAGLALPAVHVCAPPDSGGVAVTDSFGGAGSWLGGRHRMLFVEAPSGGSAALITAYLARDPDAAPLEIEIRRIGDAQEAPGAAIGESPPDLTLRMSGAQPPQQAGQPVAVDVVAHIRSRGDVRFVETPWAGRLGPGLWIEAFTLLTRNQAAAAAIEYKGLTAGGNETPWVACGAPCGTRGRGLPLIGFAIRQKAVPGGGQFDCEYTGHFQSGVTAGPLRNGAPCLSPNENDPLEGIQLRVTSRPPRAAG